jgi:hypothetical protein
MATVCAGAWLGSQEVSSCCSLLSCRISSAGSYASRSISLRGTGLGSGSSNRTWKLVH